ARLQPERRRRRPVRLPRGRERARADDPRLAGVRARPLRLAGAGRDGPRALRRGQGHDRARREGVSEPTLRLGTPADADAVDALMKASAAALFPRFYNERQSASAVRYVSVVDLDLLADGTYFVLEHEGEVVACGGWSRRDKLYTGGDAEGTDRLLDP